MHCFASIEDAQAKIDAWRWDALIEKQLVIEDERAIFPGGARAVLLIGQAPYRALGIPDVRHRRGKDAKTQVLMRRTLARLPHRAANPRMAPDGEGQSAPVRGARSSVRCSGVPSTTSTRLW